MSMNVYNTGNKPALDSNGSPPPPAGDGHSTHIFGVFDGHGGETCSQFIVDTFVPTFIQNPAPDTSVSDHLSRTEVKKDMRKSLLRNLVMTVMKTEYAFCQRALSRNDTSGSCGIAVGVHDSYLAYASVGDCELVLVSSNG